MESQPATIHLQNTKKYEVTVKAKGLKDAINPIRRREKLTVISSSDSVFLVRDQLSSAVVNTSDSNFKHLLS